MNLKELSETLGLSPTTVSRALNGYPEVNKRTREKVIAAAREHGYMPNDQARRLATGSAMAIGHVIPMSQHEMMNPIFGDFIAGAGEVYSQNDFDMVIAVVEDSEEEEAYRRISKQRKVDAVMVHGPRTDDPRPALLQEIGLPFMLHGRTVEPDGTYSWVDVNNRRAFARATKLLLDLGHTRIALLNGLESMSFALRRRAGFESAMADAGLSPDPALMRTSDMTEPYGYETALEMLRSETPPTAFLVSSLIPANGVARAISECGMVMGRDVSVVTHDDSLSFLPNSGDVPLYTCTRSSVRGAGRRAAELLIETIRSDRTEPVTELWEAELVVGRSTGPLNTA